MSSQKTAPNTCQRAIDDAAEAELQRLLRASGYTPRHPVSAAQADALRREIVGNLTPSITATHPDCAAQRSGR